MLGEVDPILALGAIVARELYGKVTPVVVATDPSLPIQTGADVVVDATVERARILS